MANFEKDSSELLALFAACGKETPTEDSDEGRAVSILQKICDSQSHTIPTIEEGTEQEEAESECAEFFDSIEEVAEHIGEDDFWFEFDGNEYRLIGKSAIWDIYVDAIKDIVEDCYDLKLDKVPDFIAVSIDWGQTAQNAYVDGYGHTFSGYDGSEEESAGYYIFRTN